MKRTSGIPEIVIGLVDGPVAMNHPQLTGKNIREIGPSGSGTCRKASSVACMHGTFVAGILSAKRGAAAPAICPDCTLLVRSIFSESTAAAGSLPSATPEGLAAAIIECVDAGARILNLSSALVQAPSARGQRLLEGALDYAAARGVLVVASAGNQGSVGSTAITRHPGVIAVSACNSVGRPLAQSNLGNSIGRRGWSAPGEGVASLAADGRTLPVGGTSVSAPFVTGAIALVWSQFPKAKAGQMKLAMLQARTQHRPTVVPELLNAQAINDSMSALYRKN